MLKTSKTLLRYPVPDDNKFFIKIRNDIELQCMLMSRPKANNLNKIESWLNQKLSDAHIAFFVIADTVSGLPIGYIQLDNIDFISRKCKLGVCIDSAYHGQGYAADAFFLIESYAKKIFNIRKIAISVLLNNKRAISFYEKMMYRTVGFLQEDFYLDNEFHDVLLMEKMI